MALHAAGEGGPKECLHHRATEATEKVVGVRKGSKECHHVGTDAKAWGDGVCQSYDIWGSMTARRWGLR